MKLNLFDVCFSVFKNYSKLFLEQWEVRIASSYENFDLQFVLNYHIHVWPHKQT